MLFLPNISDYLLFKKYRCKYNRYLYPAYTPILTYRLNPSK
nr:MAG TPA: hypothetical protein [Caudoviricetes sp.]